MRHTVLMVMILLGFAAHVCAAEFKDFTKDSQQAVLFWKTSVGSTSKKDKATTVKVLNGMLKEWSGIQQKYSSSIPTDITNLKAFTAMLNGVDKSAKTALSLSKKGKLKEAHEVLEEIRYLMWNVRAENGIQPLIDVLNDFHEIMEIVIETAEMSETPEEFSTIVNRWGYWMKSKWFDIGAKIKATGGDKTMLGYYEEGKQQIDIFMEGARKADIDMVDPAAHKVKKNFKKLFFSKSVY